MEAEHEGEFCVSSRDKGLLYNSYRGCESCDMKFSDSQNLTKIGMLHLGITTWATCRLRRDVNQEAMWCIDLALAPGRGLCPDSGAAQTQAQAHYYSPQTQETLI